MSNHNNINSSEPSSSLLSRFNSRDNAALAELYNLYYDELFYFTNQLYRNSNIEACDILHDIFIKIWVSKTLKFETLKNIKAYIYVSIKNSFYDYISHNKCVDKYTEISKSNPSNFISEIIESETLSIISKATELLPEETSKIFKMILDGWSVKDISASIGCSKSYVYQKKEEAVKILKDKILKNSLSIMLIISNL